MALDLQHQRAFGIAMILIGLSFLLAARTEQSMRSIDLVGAVTALLAYAVAQTATNDRSSPHTMWPFGAAVVLLAHFVVHETRVSHAPLIPFDLVRLRNVVGANLIQLIAAGLMVRSAARGRRSSSAPRGRANR
ncbi:hypothetical protein [Nocardia sp. NPDC051750]|uniref:hypothetical protein n=1 Tax=Nocardia sp. NPDC051750 TaxID=3364325 RepID=UPI0037ADD40D